MAANSLMNISPGLKVASQMSPEPGPEEFAFNRQMGVEYTVIWIEGAEASPEYYRSRREEFEKHGIRLFVMGNSRVHNPEAIVLNLPDRDRKVEEISARL